MAGPLMAPLMIASAAMGAVGSIRSGNAANEAAKGEALRMNMAADQTMRDGLAEDERARIEQRRALGLQLAASAEAGAGINADQLRQSIYDQEMDSAAIRYGAATRAQGLNDQANIRRAEGKSARTAGYLNAAGTLLNSGASYYDRKARLDAAKTRGRTE